MSNATIVLISIAVIMVAAVPTAMVMKDFLPTFLERSANIDQLENRIYLLHAEAQELQDRVAGLTVTRNQQSNERTRVESDIRKAERMIQELAARPPLFVHEVGEPKAGMTKYTVNLSQESGSSRTRGGGERAPVNPIWRCANVAEVWANTYEEAKQQVEVSFPFKLGFLKTFAARPKDAAKAGEANAADPKMAETGVNAGAPAA